MEKKPQKTQINAKTINKPEDKKTKEESFSNLDHRRDFPLLSENKKTYSEEMSGLSD